jgi:hypothetical protein
MGLGVPSKGGDEGKKRVQKNKGYERREKF